ncbi:hypothetical protein C4D60_Mb01t18210 [Musa balbisiana]|uniref:Uncharacterized protein n=1 Tax=Musa balbisiana TaxID=52838 RepID=A0A4S8JP14_MUSBA|nr:hypothetical protein C4D60_Mb01t18210 [Musa balbisiana]
MAVRGEPRRGSSFREATTEARKGSEEAFERSFLRGSRRDSMSEKRRRRARRRISGSKGGRGAAAAAAEEEEEEEEEEKRQ